MWLKKLHFEYEIITLVTKHTKLQRELSCNPWLAKMRFVQLFSASSDQRFFVNIHARIQNIKMTKDVVY